MAAGCGPAYGANSGKPLPLVLLLFRLEIWRFFCKRSGQDSTDSPDDLTWGTADSFQFPFA